MNDKELYDRIVKRIKEAARLQGIPVYEPVDLDWEKVKKGDG